MQVSVILCTYNRCQSLLKTLESVVASERPDGVPLEVVIVDNNSSDGTRDFLQDWCSRHSHFRYIFEPEPGLSHARNTGVREAQGDVLAFIDDDVTVEPMWLQNLVTAFQEGDPAGVGGRILPACNFSPPRWLPVNQKHALAPLALFDLGSEGGPSSEPPFGANMAFRKSVFLKYGYFRTDLGRRPGSLISNEDTEFGQRLLARGERLRYEPSSVVYHPVSEERLRKDYFLKWWLDKARADVRQSGIAADTKWFIAGIPAYLFRRLAAWTLRWMVAVRPSQRFACKVNVWANRGAIRESYALAQKTKTQLVNSNSRA